MLEMLLNSAFYDSFKKVERQDIILPSPDVIEKDGDEIEKEEMRIEKPSKYQSDLKAIEHEFGPLQTGLCITTDLQKLLGICPRERKRIDAYRGLISYLEKEKEVSLIIKSRKTK